MIPKQVNKFVITGVAILLTGCAMRPIETKTLSMPDRTATPAELQQKKQQDHILLSQGQATSVPSVQNKIQFLTPRALPQLGANKNQDNASQDLRLSLELVTLNAQDLALNKFINLALGEVLSVNYIVDTAVSDNKTPVTLHIPEPVKPGRMLGLVEEVLRLNNVALVQENGLLKVLPLAKASDTSPDIIDRNVDRLLKYGQVIEFIPISYISLGEASQLAMNYVTSNKGKIMLQQHLNALILIADQQDIDSFREMLSLMDKPAASSQFSTLVIPAFVDAKELVSTFNTTLPKQGIPIVAGSKGAGVTLTPIGETNRLLLTASSKQWLNYAQYWLSQIDQPQLSVQSENSIFTYFFKNAQAEDVTSVISDVFGSRSSANNKKKPTKKTESAVRPANLNLAKEDKEGASTNTSTSISSDNFDIVVDETRNALIFIGSYQDYSKVVDLLKVLDRRPRQVLIEANIMEVSLNDGVKYGVNWGVDGNDGSIGTNKGGITAEYGGLVLSGIFGDFQAQISAIADDGRINILSSPRLLAKDGESARISVGTQIAVKTGSISSGDNDKVVDSFTYIDTGVLLELTPTINENGLVELDVNQDVSESTGGSDTPDILKRSIQTQLVAESGQTIVLGGVIS